MPEDRYLVTKDEIENMEGQQKTHFLNPNAQCINKSLSDVAGITGFGFHIVEVQPGHASTELHFHCNEDECVYVLSGEGEATTGDETAQVTAGDFLGYRKGGLAHSIRNVGAEILRYIVVGERNESDVVDFPAKDKRMFRTKGLKWKVVDLGDVMDRPVIKRP